ncbi:Yip1 family protein [Streptomyces pacificus]|uniref:YIP1 family protein n=1 Tax=Streptomyces pacificus TaxID=2705029 RepID=A0A6A0AV85_9ACTN|nr:Yip1 family protein [Streptomyces pacificus]GFH36355.1 YIP1 family protein [Streptomyces pacificus]
MAGFRIGRGRDNDRTRQQQPQQAPPPPYGQPYDPGGGQAPPSYAPQAQAQWPRNTGGERGAGQGGPGHGNGRQAQHGEPEYFGDPYHQHQHQQPGGHRGGGHGPDPYADNPGHTQAFSIGEDPYGEGSTYHAGAAPVPSGPRLHWKELLSGIVLRPGPTFLRMRDYPVWGPALSVTFLYGLLAIFGFDQTREEAISSPFSTVLTSVVITGIGFVLGGLVLGAVTHTLARQLGGDGAWQPTVGLSMLIMSLTDAPRLLVALFLGGENSLVQMVGWVTWLGAAALFTIMVGKSHELPWPKALGASALQLIALLAIIKLGTI